MAYFVDIFGWVKYNGQRIGCIFIKTNCMNNDFKIAVRHCLHMLACKYHQAVFYLKWAACLAITSLVWGGAIWFGSLAWDQKQGAVLAVMGFGAWLAVFRFVLPGFWYLSKEVIKQFFRYINYRFL